MKGKKFGRLTVVKLSCNDNFNNRTWICVCDCGRQKVVTTTNLNNGTRSSCGCLKSEKVSKRLKKHGMSRSSIYRTWCLMISRCNNKNSTYYHRYGGRGIFVSDPWLKFENFYYDMGEKPTKYHTLDRIDNDGPYSKLNCRWATRMQQSSNMSSNTWIVVAGIRKTISQWARLLDISASIICSRIANGWSKSDAIKRIPKRGVAKDKQEIRDLKSIS